MSVPAGLFYSKEHEWVKVEGNKAYIGITEFAQNELGDIVFVELPEVDDTIAAGDVFGNVESVKTVSDLYAPVSGKVVEINEALADSPELVNESPYEDAWMIAIELDDASQLDALLDAAGYEAVISQ
ncbi:MAG: glycine cleavage system protein GcvH [Caryophanon sp.]|nr:glycine cleavage system protein GcvH [Caryophanon sp.]